jgi:hypothetical protein
MTQKLARSVSAHIHGDLDVTLRRVRAFSAADLEVQLQVQAELRRRVNDESNAALFALYGIAIAVVGLFVSPAKGLNLLGLPIWASLVIGLFLGVVGAAVALPFAIGPVVRSLRRERALIWLAAYEDEIARRRGERGLRGRRWRSAH